MFSRTELSIFRLNRFAEAVTLSERSESKNPITNKPCLSELCHL